MDIKESYNKLSEFSEIAKKMIEQSSSRIVNIRNSMSITTEDITFHPNGNCGSIKLDDETMFGIRCDHLIWAEGTCEGTETFMDGIKNKDAILVCGNHKGGLVIELLTFSRKSGESSYAIE